MGGFSLWHILIFAIIVLLLFGGNRFSAMMGDVAKGLKSFKKGMSEDDDARPDPSRQQRLEDRPIDVTPQPPRPAEPTAPPPPADDQSRN